MDHLTFALTLTIILGVGAQWLAWRLRVPTIVLLIAAGIIAGPVLGWVRPSQDLGELLDPVIKLGVAVILFEGGLNLRFHELKHSGSGIARLVTLGALFGLVLGSLAGHFVGGLSWPVASVFGAIIVVTGPTVIVPLLRQARLRRRPAHYLKWEGIVNDPVGALLAVLAFQYFAHPAQSEWQVLAMLAAGLGAAASLGGVGGYALGMAFRPGYVPEFLKGPVALAAALLVFVLANRVVEESGLLAATILGIVLGNMRLPSIDEMRRFKEYLTVLLLSTVFILLTAEIDPAIVLRLGWRGVALLLVVLVVVRPVSVLLATLRSDMTMQERALLAWIAPRGIVAAAMAGVFETPLKAHGYPGADLLLPLVFSLILLTVVAHGFSIGWVARRLGLRAESQNGLLIVGASPWTRDLAKALQDLDVPVMIVDSSWHRLQQPRLAGIPVFYGEILSEASEQALELSDFDRVLAATENDAYNALVCTRFAPELGRNRVYQLPQGAAEKASSKRLTHTLRGLTAPSGKAVHTDLMASWYAGWTFQKTQLTKEFDYEAGMQRWPGASLPVAIVRNDSLYLSSVEQPLVPKPGDTVVWFGPKSAGAQREAGALQAVSGTPPDRTAESRQRAT